MLLLDPSANSVARCRWGVISYADSLECVGILARDVESAESVLGLSCFQNNRTVPLMGSVQIVLIYPRSSRPNYHNSGRARKRVGIDYLAFFRLGESFRAADRPANRGFGPEVKRRILLGTYALTGEYVFLELLGSITHEILQCV